MDLCFDSIHIVIWYRQLRALPGSRPACPRVNVGPLVWETYYSLVFATKDFNPYTDESKFLVAIYFMKVAISS